MISSYTRDTYKQFYKTNRGKSGVYYLKCGGNNKIYIGSSKNISKRISAHFTQMKGNYHNNYKLQDSYNLFGESSFEFGVVEYVDDLTILVKREKQLAEVYGALTEERGLTLMIEENLEGRFRKRKSSQNKRQHGKKVVRINVKNPEIVIYPTLSEAKKFCSWVEQGINKEPKVHLTHNATYCWMFFDEFEKIPSVSNYIEGKIRLHNTPKRIKKDTNYTILDSETGIYYSSMLELYDSLIFDFPKTRVYYKIRELSRFVILRDKVIRFTGRQRPPVTWRMPSGPDHPHFGKSMPEELRRKLSEKKKKPVYQYTLDGILVREWSSATDAARELGLHASAIGRVCLGKQSQSGGFVWRLKNMINAG